MGAIFDVMFASSVPVVFDSIQAAGMSADLSME